MLATTDSCNFKGLLTFLWWEHGNQNFRWNITDNMSYAGISNLHWWNITDNMSYAGISNIHCSTYHAFALLFHKYKLGGTLDLVPEPVIWNQTNTTWTSTTGPIQLEHLKSDQHNLNIYNQTNTTWTSTTGPIQLEHL